MCVSLYVVLSICYTCRFRTRNCGIPGEISKSLYVCWALAYVALAYVFVYLITM